MDRSPRALRTIALVIRCRRYRSVERQCRGDGPHWDGVCGRTFGQGKPSPLSCQQHCHRSPLSRKNADPQNNRSVIVPLATIGLFENESDQPGVRRFCITSRIRAVPPFGSCHSIFVNFSGKAVIFPAGACSPVWGDPAQNPAFLHCVRFFQKIDLIPHGWLSDPIFAALKLREIAIDRPA